MGAPLMGGLAILQAPPPQWVGMRALRVWFSSTYGSTYLYQLYAGRDLVGVTENPNQRSLIGTVDPALWPRHVQLLAVEPKDRLVSYGESLPLRPYNVARVRATAGSFPADSDRVRFRRGSSPGGAVDTIFDEQDYDIDREYESFSDPLTGSGNWNLEAAGIDQSGNVGAALAIAANNIYAHPPDVVLTDGKRFTVAIASQTATITATKG